MKTLNIRGIKAELNIVRCSPPIEEDFKSFVKIHGFISKESKEGKEKLRKLFEEAHFFIMTSNAECFGIVYCEANSYGIPCIASDVGGVSTVIKNNVNGILVRKGETVENIFNHIEKSFSNPEFYREFGLSSFNEFSTRLNWKAAGYELKKQLEVIL